MHHSSEIARFCLQASNCDTPTQMKVDLYLAVAKGAIKRISIFIIIILPWYTCISTGDYLLFGFVKYIKQLFCCFF